jgi:hypothetical protein
VIQAWDATVVAEVACAAVVHTAEAFTQEATVVWESITALARDTEDRATLAEREA